MILDTVIGDLGIDGTPYVRIVTQNFIFHLNFIQLSKVRAYSSKMILDTHRRRPGCPGIDRIPNVCIVTQNYIFHWILFNFQKFAFIPRR